MKKKTLETRIAQSKCSMYEHGEYRILNDSIFGITIKNAFEKHLCVVQSLKCVSEPNENI